MSRFLREQGPVPARTREQAMRTIRLRRLCVCPTCRAADPLRQAVWDTDTMSLRKGLNVRSPGRRRVEVSEADGHSVVGTDQGERLETRRCNCEGGAGVTVNLDTLRSGALKVGRIRCLGCETDLWP